jgi:hypothetical protein
MATLSQSGSAAVLGRLLEGATTAGKLLADMEIEKKIGPLVDNGKQAAKAGLEVVAHVGGHALEVVSQEKLWVEQRALVDSMIEVLGAQQALIEHLLDRVSALEIR